MLEEVLSQAFWIGLAKIIGVNIILSGDNAVVIALAARSLPAKQQKLAIFWGAGAAIVLRIILTLFAVALLTLPWLKLVGSLLLFWIGVKLLIPEDGDPDIKAHEHLMSAIKTILIADLSRDLDPAGDIRRHAAGQADGPISRHHHHRRRPDRLGGGRNARHRPRAEGLAWRARCRIQGRSALPQRLQSRDHRRDRRRRHRGRAWKMACKKKRRS
jgi:YjbE family integral membrane protein